MIRRYALLALMAVASLVAGNPVSDGNSQTTTSTVDRNMLLRIQVSVDIMLLPSQTAIENSVIEKLFLSKINDSISFIATLDNIERSGSNDGPNQQSNQLVDSSLLVEHHLVLPWTLHWTADGLHAHGNATLSLLLPFHANTGLELSAQTIMVALWEDAVYTGGSVKPVKLLSRRLANLPRTKAEKSGGANREIPIATALSEQRSAGPFIVVRLHGMTALSLDTAPDVGSETKGVRIRLVVCRAAIVTVVACAACAAIFVAMRRRKSGKEGGLPINFSSPSDLSRPNQATASTFRHDGENESNNIEAASEIKRHTIDAGETTTQSNLSIQQQQRSASTSNPTQYHSRRLAEPAPETRFPTDYPSEYASESYRSVTTGISHPLLATRNVPNDRGDLSFSQGYETPSTFLGFDSAESGRSVHYEDIGRKVDFLERDTGEDASLPVMTGDRTRSFVPRGVMLPVPSKENNGETSRHNYNASNPTKHAKQGTWLQQLRERTQTNSSSGYMDTNMSHRSSGQRMMSSSMLDDSSISGFCSAGNRVGEMGCATGSLRSTPSLRVPSRHAQGQSRRSNSGNNRIVQIEPRHAQPGGSNSVPLGQDSLHQRSGPSAIYAEGPTGERSSTEPPRYKEYIVPLESDYQPPNQRHNAPRESLTATTDSSGHTDKDTVSLTVGNDSSAVRKAARPQPARKAEKSNSTLRRDKSKGRSLHTASASKNISRSNRTRASSPRRVSLGTPAISSRKRPSRDQKTGASSNRNSSTPKRQRLAEPDDLLLLDVVPSEALSSAAKKVNAPVWEFDS